MACFFVNPKVTCIYAGNEFLEGFDRGIESVTSSVDQDIGLLLFLLGEFLFFTSS